MHDENAVGRIFKSPEPIRVTQAAIDSLSEALGHKIPAKTATPMYMFVLAKVPFEMIYTDECLNLNLARLIHAEQSFEYIRPISAGDDINVTLTIKSMRTRGKLEIIKVHGVVACADAKNELFGTFETTLMHNRGERA